jgi:hypothetical protein
MTTQLPLALDAPIIAPVNEVPTPPEALALVEEALRYGYVVKALQGGCYGAWRADTGRVVYGCVGLDALTERVNDWRRIQRLKTWLTDWPTTHEPAPEPEAL